MLLLTLLAGCATQTASLVDRSPVGLPRRAEVAGVPFIPQERYQCGPAALAMSLQAAGIQVSADSLVPQVFLPEREGSLQVEMLAAGRRNGALSMTIPPRLDALLTEVAAGQPVLVLQNLGLSIAPRWHYAVAIGYDLDRAEIRLHSGTTANLSMPLSTFEHTWRRSEFWAMVTLPPDRMAVTADEAAAVEALLAFEKNVAAPRARQAYATALERWPRNLTLQLGYGNTAYAAGDRAAALAAFEQASAEHPESAPALNNLAVVLSELGRYAEARSAAEKALAIGGIWRDAALDTLRTVEAAQARASRQ